MGMCFAPHNEHATNKSSMNESRFDRVILIVLDSVGAGAAQDAKRFGDQGANTLLHISEWAHKNMPNFQLKNLAKLGLNKIIPNAPIGFHHQGPLQGSYGTLIEHSPGKDTTTGHWEMAGTILKSEFPVYSNGFPKKLLEDWCHQNQLAGWLCNQAASGTAVLDDFGEEHLRTLKPIVYTSADSVFQIACSEEVFGLERLYDISKSARKLLDPLGVGRIIARPFVGKSKGNFKRTENRRDFSVPPPYPNLLDILVGAQCFVAGVGKIEDIFAHRSVTLVDHTGRNETSLEATLKMLKETQGKRGLIFTNLIDFDQLHGHRRNPKTYAEALMAFDDWFPQLEETVSQRDLVVLTADHGNDPTHTGTDHTREDVPLFLWSSNKHFQSKALGKMQSFATIAKVCLEALGLESALEKIPDTQVAPSLSHCWEDRQA